ncbi:MAG TPA: hypothetical protein VEC16_06105 [Alphaproteobacteria bacterium]|nr:hypothetical protein [Alphaproteobacteria bacterium]
MSKYSDLNTIIGKYILYSKDANNQLLLLQENLRNIPIILPKLPENLNWDDFYITAELRHPTGYNVSNFTKAIFELENYNAEELSKKIVFPYTSISILTAGKSRPFYNQVNGKLDNVFYPDERESTVKMLYDKNYGTGLVGFTYQKNNKTQFLEMILADDKW